MVPLTPDLLTIDYISQQNYPIILVTSGRLGSINHTLLSLEAIKNRNLKLYSVIYNLSPYTDEVIVQDSLKIIDQYIRKNFPESFSNTNAGGYYIIKERGQITFCLRSFVNDLLFLFRCIHFSFYFL